MRSGDTTNASDIPLCAACLAGALLLGAAACSQEAPPATKSGEFGALEPFLSVGESKVWTAERDGPVFRLTNTKRDNLVRRIFLEFDETIVGKRKVSVTVGINKDSDRARAGLVFGVREKAKDYYIFVLEPGNSVSLFHRSESGQEELLKVRNDSIVDNKARLSIHEEGQRLTLLVNGQHAAVYDLPLPDRGSAGIIAWGRGTFEFSDFTHSPEPGAAQ